MAQNPGLTPGANFGLTLRVNSSNGLTLPVNSANDLTLRDNSANDFTSELNIQEMGWQRVRRYCAGAGVAPPKLKLTVGGFSAPGVDSK
jgi:hypothetical protein